MSDTTYKTGSTLGQIFAENAAAENSPVVTEPVITPVVEPQLSTQVNADGQLVATTTEPAPIVAPEVVVPVEDNVSVFAMPDEADIIVGDKPAVQPEFNWDEAIQKVGHKELAKKLGFDDFDMEFMEYRKKGGDPYKYLEAKSFDWNKVSYPDIVKDDMKRQYPELTAEQINILFNKRYSQTELADEDEKIAGAVLLEADGYEKKQKRIAEQQSFKIPIVQAVVAQTTVETDQKEIESIQRQQQYFINHEATKSFLESKRVAISLGEGKNFNFQFDKPDVVLKGITDASQWRKLTIIKQGDQEVPDIQKLIKISAYALNPEKHDRDIFNYGQSLGQKKLVEEGQNAIIPTKIQPPAPNETERDAWKGRVKSSTLGAR